MTEAELLRERVKWLLWFFVVALVLSGITAFPLKWEVDILQDTIGRGSLMENLWPALANWISHVHQGITETHQKYPFLFYGTDWLAFAHLVIAAAFWGPLRDPVKNIWVIEFGMVACVMVIPLALICGPIRGIPFFWRLFDCAFGIFGIIPLWIARTYMRRIIELERNTGANYNVDD
jgi:hypothetical protein